MRKLQVIRREIMAKEIAEAEMDRLNQTELARLAEKQIIENLLMLDNAQLEEKHDDHFA